MVPFGIVVPNMEAVAADFALGQMLKQQPAGKAARFGIVARGKLDQARNLLRLLEIMLGSLADRRAFERDDALIAFGGGRSEEHTSELQSLMRISYAVFCLKKKKNSNKFACVLNDYDHHLM